MSPQGSDDSYSRHCDDSFQGHGGAGSEIVLFGVRVKVDPMRKCVSLNDLSDYAHHHHPQPQDVPPNAAAADAAGYASADDANHQRPSGSRERKRGIPWSEEEHKLFLLGLQNAGKGDWRGISRNFVKTRTPTQVASHAQKHFLRRSNLNKRRRRSSLFDITSESIAAISMEEEKLEDNTNQFIQPPKQTLNTVIGSQVSPIPVCVQIENDDVNNECSRSVLVQPIIPFLQTPISSNSTITTDLNSMTHNHPLISLDLSLSSGENHLARNNSSFQMGPNLNNGKSIISVV